MKKLFLILSAITIVLTSSGCLASRLDKVVKELGKDPATVHIRVTSLYGTLEFTRTAPTTNSAPHTISPDGTITVK